MERKNFIKYASTTIIIAGITYYLTSDRSNFERVGLEIDQKMNIPIWSRFAVPLTVLSGIDFTTDNN
ncbi:hypothetical protein [Sphingobacterium faecium]|uniref:hypothetical protein n=1 Tax=Sphingobacterium faecium TaxID=34087 RepID=UPI003209CD11